MAQESILRIVIDSRNAERNAQALDRELRSIERNGDFASRSMDGFSVACRQLAGYMMGVVTAGAAIAKMDMYTGLRNRLKLVTEDQNALNKAMSDTFAIAQSTAQAWDSVAQIYQRFSDNAKQLNLTQAKTAALTDTVAKAISISGGSASSAEAALIQFSQALSSNVLRGEELNSVMEQAPGLAKAIAQGMGITVGQLRSVAAEGKITGDVLVEALTKAKDSVDDLFAKTDFTIGQSLTQLSNAVTQFIGEAGQGSGAATMLSSSIKNLADNLDLVVNAGTAVAMGYVAKSMMLGAMATSKATYSLIAKVDATIAERQANIAATQAEVASAIAEAQSTEAKLANLQATRAQIVEELRLELRRMKMQFSTQGTINSELRMALLRQQQVAINAELLATETALAASSTRLSVALAAQAAATSRLALGKAALMAMFSPMGIAIAATAAAFYFLSSSAEEVKESLATQSESVEALTKKYLELNSVQAQVESVRLRKEVDAQKDSIDDAESSIGRFIYLQKELFKISGDDYKQYKQAIKAIATGADDAGVMLQKMVASGHFSQDQVDRLVEYSGEVADSKNKINQNNTALELLTKTSGQHTVVTKESTKQLADQAGALKIATQNFSDMKAHVIESLQAQVEFSKLNGASKDQVKTLNGVIKQYSSNQISATDAVSNFNASAKMPSNVLTGLQNYATKTDGAKKEVNSLAEKIKQLNILSPNTVKATDDRAAAADRERKAIEATTKAYAEYRKDALADIKEMAARAKLQEMGLSKNQIEERLKVLKALNYDPAKTHSQVGIEMKKLADISAGMKDVEDAKAEAIKKQNKELKDQEKIKNRLVGLVGSTGGSTGNHLDIRYDRSYSNGAISAEHMARFKLGGKALDPKNSNSSYGMRTHPISGKQQLHRGYDFPAPAGTEVTTNFAVKDVQTFYDKKGGGYTSRVTFEDGVVVNLLHQIPEMKSKIKGGASKGHSASSNEAYEAFEAQQKELDQLELEQYQSRERIFYDFADRTGKIEKDLENQIREIQQSNFSPEHTKQYIDAATNRAQLEKEIFISQIEFQVNEFQLSEEGKLKAKHRINKLMLQADRDVSEENKEIQETFLEKQHQKELAVIQFAREEREFQMRLQFISETQAMEKRYELEEQKLIEVNDLQERNFKREMLRLQKQEEVKNRSDNALQNWGSIQSEIYGTGEMDQLGHTRNERYNTSEELFNSNMSSIDQQEQDPTADLFEIAALREKAWQEHHDRMKLIDQEYWSSSRALQFSMASDMFGTITNMLKESGAERTGIYRGMLVVEKGFAIASAAVQIPDAMAKALNAPFPANIAAMGTVASLGASIVSSIQSVAAGFATGGHVRGPGTSTSDSIPAMLSDYEFVTKASAVKKIGVANMEYMNRTGEMPFQKEYEELHKRIAGNQLPEPFIVPKYKDGGLVGSSRVQPDAYSQIYREREVVDKVKAVNVQPKITINTPPGTYAETRVDTDGAITIDVIRKEAEDAAKRSWDRLGNANSHESQQLSRNTNSNRRR